MFQCSNLKIRICQSRVEVLKNFNFSLIIFLRVSVIATINLKILWLWTSEWCPPLLATWLNMTSCGFETELFIACYFCLKVLKFSYYSQFSNLLYALLQVAALSSNLSNLDCFKCSNIQIWTVFKILEFVFFVIIFHSNFFNSLLKSVMILKIWNLSFL